MKCDACNKCRPHPELPGKCFYYGPYRFSNDPVIITEAIVRANYPSFTDEQVREMVRAAGLAPAKSCSQSKRYSC